MSVEVVQDTVVAYFVTKGLDEFMNAIGQGGPDLEGKLNEILGKLDEITKVHAQIVRLLEAISTHMAIAEAATRTNQIEARINTWVSRLQALLRGKLSKAAKKEKDDLIADIINHATSDIGTYHRDLTTVSGSASNTGNSKPLMTLWLDEALKALVNTGGRGTLQDLYRITIPNYLQLLADYQRNIVMFYGMVNKADDGFYLQYKKTVEDNIVAQRKFAYEHYACKSYEYFVEASRHGPLKFVSNTTSTPDILTSSINENRETGIKLSNPSNIDDNSTWGLEIVANPYSNSGDTQETCSIWRVRMLYDQTNVVCAKYLVRNLDGFGYRTAHENTAYGEKIKVTLRFIPYGYGDTGRFPFTVYEVYDNNVPRLFCGFDWSDPNGSYHLERAAYSTTTTVTIGNTTTTTTTVHS